MAVGVRESHGETCENEFRAMSSGLLRACSREGRPLHCAPLGRGLILEAEIEIDPAGAAPDAASIFFNAHACHAPSELRYPRSGSYRVSPSRPCLLFAGGFDGSSMGEQGAIGGG